MPRLPDATARLHALLVQRQAQPFAWGSRDCALFVADAVQAVTGHDPAADLRGSYASCMQAWRTLARGGGLEAVAHQRLGPPIALSQAQDGDVVLLSDAVVRDEPIGALGIVWGGGVVAQGAAGLVRVDLADARRAWRAAS